MFGEKYSRFFLKSKMDNADMHTNLNANLSGQKLVRCERNTKEEDTRSRVRYWAWDWTTEGLNVNR